MKSDKIMDAEQSDDKRIAEIDAQLEKDWQTYLSRLPKKTRDTIEGLQEVKALCKTSFGYGFGCGMDAMQCLFLKEIKSREKNEHPC
jgi:hypothetical protein